MQIIGFNFEKISAEKHKDVQGKLSINSNIEIDDITKEKIDVFKDKNILKFKFSFTVKYEPGVADLAFKGSILVVFPEEEEKDILKKFKKKKVEDAVRIPLFNIILTRSSVKALQMEEDLQLPLHIPFPRVSPPKEGVNYTG